jgi:hypothetical protein
VESFQEEFCDFELFLALLCYFAWLPLFTLFASFYGFPFFYMTFLSFLLALGLVAVLHGVLVSNFKLCTFCCQWTYQGRD